MSGPNDTKLEDELAEKLGFDAATKAAISGGDIKASRRAIWRMRESMPSKFRRLAFNMHPDRCPDDAKAKEKFVRLCDVRDSLMTMRAGGSDAAGWTDRTAIDGIIKTPTEEELERYSVKAERRGSGVSFSSAMRSMGFKA